MTPTHRKASEMINAIGEELAVKIVIQKLIIQKINGFMKLNYWLVNEMKKLLSLLLLMN